MDIVIIDRTLLNEKRSSINRNTNIHSYIHTVLRLSVVVNEAVYVDLCNVILYKQQLLD